MKPMSPCYECKDRYLGCHSQCVKYITFKKELDTHNKKVRKQQMLENQLLASDLKRKKIY